MNIEFGNRQYQTNSFYPSAANSIPLEKSKVSLMPNYV
jgi:hypothetical protein